MTKKQKFLANLQQQKRNGKVPPEYQSFLDKYQNINAYNFGLEPQDESMIELGKDKQMKWLGPIEKFGEFSSKIQFSLDLLRTTRGKSLVFDEHISYSGLNFIRSVISAYGYIEWTSVKDITRKPDIKYNSICFKCRKAFKDHKTENHDFKPIYFAMMHGGLDEKMRADINGTFESITNLHGEEISFLLLSKAYVTGWDFSAIVMQIHLTIFESIGMTLQTIGRAIRYRASMGLSPD